MEPISLQGRYFPDMRCFGCGPANDRGLQLRSFADGDPAEPAGPTRPSAAVTATFRPWPEHDNGLGYLNGGIIATLLDCHSAAAMMLHADTLGLISGAGLPFVTAGLDIRYRRPSPLDEPVSLRARIDQATDDTLTITTELWWEDRVRAEGTAIWRRWRPR